MKLPLTDATRAAILAGAVEIEVDVEAAGQQAQAGALDAEAEATAAAAAAAAQASAATPAPTETQATPAAAGAPSELVSFLKGELSTAQGALTAAQIEIAQLKAAAASAAPAAPDTAVQDGLLAIARGVLGNMSVALGGNKTAVEAMDAKAVLAEHARVQPLFAAKFKVGGVAVTTPLTDKPQAQVISPDFQARLASIR
jgi:hypothetical protein